MVGHSARLHFKGFLAKEVRQTKNDSYLPTMLLVCPVVASTTVREEIAIHALYKWDQIGPTLGPPTISYEACLGKIIIWSC